MCASARSSFLQQHREPSEAHLSVPIHSLLTTIHGPPCQLDMSQLPPVVSGAPRGVPDSGLILQPSPCVSVCGTHQGPCRLWMGCSHLHFALHPLPSAFRDGGSSLGLFNQPISVLPTDLPFSFLHKYICSRVGLGGHSTYVELSGTHSGES